MPEEAAPRAKSEGEPQRWMQTLPWDCPGLGASCGGACLAPPPCTDSSSPSLHAHKRPSLRSRGCDAAAAWALSLEGRRDRPSCRNSSATYTCIRLPLRGMLARLLPASETVVHLVHDTPQHTMMRKYVRLDRNSAGRRRRRRLTASEYVTEGRERASARAGS